MKQQKHLLMRAEGFWGCLVVASARACPCGGKQGDERGTVRGGIMEWPSSPKNPVRRTR